MVFYVTLWFPARVRGQVLGLFYLGVPLALVIGGPLSGALLDLGARGGLAGWQWMFLVEGLMASVLGIVAFALLRDHPSQARWLPAEESLALEASLAREASLRRSTGPARLASIFRDSKVLAFLLVYMLIQMSTYGAVFYLPAEISALVHQPEGFLVGALSAIPWLCALAAVYFLPRAGDIHRNHRQLASLTLLISGLASFAFPSTGPVLGLVMLSIAVSGFVAVQPLFWTFPTGYLADRAAAGGIAVIGMGNIGGFLAPNVKVWADSRFHSTTAGLYLLAALTVLNAIFIALVARPRSPAHLH
jgi:MFS family permease